MPGLRSRVEYLHTAVHQNGSRKLSTRCECEVCRCNLQFWMSIWAHNFLLGISLVTTFSQRTRGTFSLPLGWKLAFRRLGFGDFGIVIALTSWLRNGYVYPRNLQKPDNLDLRMSISCKWYWVYTSEHASKNLRRQGSQHQFDTSLNMHRHKNDIGHIPTLHVAFFRRWIQLPCKRMQFWWDVAAISIRPWNQCDTYFWYQTWHQTMVT